MANPITWRNVNQTATAGAAGSLFRGGQQSLTDGFGALQGVLDQARQTQQANHETRRDNNTDAFLDRLYGYDSADDLAAAREAGELQALRQQLGPNIDRQAVREALFNQGDNLRNRDTNRANFADFTTRRDQRGVVDQIQTLAAQGDTRGAQALMAQNPDLLDRGELATEVRDAGFAQEDQQFQREGNQRGWISTRLAQASNARSAESHALKMQAAQLELADLTTDRAVQSAAAEGMIGVLDAERGYLQQSADVAKQMGLPMRDGKPDISKMSDAQAKEFRQTLDKLEIQAPPSRTEWAQSMGEEMLRRGAITVDELPKFSQDLLSGFDSRNLQTAAQQEEQAAQEAFVTQHYASERANNPFAGDAFSGNAREATTQIMSDVFGEGFDLITTDAEINRADRNVFQLMTEGVPIPGTNESIKLPYSAVQQIAQRAGRNFWDPEGSVIKEAQAYIEEGNNLEMLRAAQDIDKREREDLSKLRTQRSKSTGDTGYGAQDIDRALDQRLNR